MQCNKHIHQLIILISAAMIRKKNPNRMAKVAKKSKKNLNKNSCKNPKTSCKNARIITTPFNYITPGLTLTNDEIEQRRDEDLQTLISRKKLHLVLDLDNTLLHSISSRRPSLKDKKSTDADADDDLHEVDGGKFVAKLRPGARTFLEQASSMFDLTIYSMAVRPYVRDVARVLDPESQEDGLFGSRVISREDFVTKWEKGLDIVLSHSRVVLIVDDMVHAWRIQDQANVIKIAPYEFFFANSINDGLKKKCLSKLRELDESEKEGELARVLEVLRAVHSNFYSDYYDGGNLDYASRDVRQVLQRVQTSSIRPELCLTSQAQKEDDQDDQKRGISSDDEASKTWEIGKAVGLTCHDDNAPISTIRAIRRSKRLEKKRRAKGI